MNATPQSVLSWELTRAEFIRDRLPQGGLFAGHEWRISPEPFLLDPKVAAELELLGRVLLQFYRSVNLLYRQSAEGKQPGWIAQLLDQGKPEKLIQLQRDPAFKHDLPRVIRPDILITEEGLSIIELDSVPGGIGLTAWLNQSYAAAAKDPALANAAPETQTPNPDVIGGSTGMVRGFEAIFNDADHVHVVLSEEASTYRPEMEWMASQLPPGRFTVRDTAFQDFKPGDAVYRFFELFDLAQVPNADAIFQQARQNTLRLTPPPKTIFEEKLLFALLWNRNLAGFWRRELGEGFFKRMLELVPYSWVIDPTPLPPHAAYPGLHLTDWQQLKTLSKRERELILKISGFSDQAWGSRGVYLGSDLSHEEWSAAVDKALAGFSHSPFLLQRYHKPKIVPARYFDFSTKLSVPMPGRVRLCPYYFVHGDAQSARPQLGGVLATICPADKKIIHGMKDAILAPCSVGTEPASVV